MAVQRLLNEERLPDCPPLLSAPTRYSTSACDATRSSSGGGRDSRIAPPVGRDEFVVLAQTGRDRGASAPLGDGEWAVVADLLRAGLGKESRAELKIAAFPGWW